MRLISLPRWPAQLWLPLRPHPRDQRPPAGGGEGRDGLLRPGGLVSAGGSHGQTHHVILVHLGPLGGNQGGDVPPGQAAQHRRPEARHRVHGVARLQERKARQWPFQHHIHYRFFIFSIIWMVCMTHIMQGQKVAVNTEVMMIFYVFLIVNKSREKTKAIFLSDRQRRVSRPDKSSPSVYKSDIIVNKSIETLVDMFLHHEYTRCISFWLNPTFNSRVLQMWINPPQKLVLNKSTISSFLNDLWHLIKKLQWSAV